MMEPKGQKLPSRSGGFRYGIKRQYDAFFEKHLGSDSGITWKRIIMTPIWALAVATPLAAGCLTWYAVKSLWTVSAIESAKTDIKEPWDADPSRTKESRTNELYSNDGERVDREYDAESIPQRPVPAPKYKVPKKPEKPNVKRGIANNKKKQKSDPDAATAQKQPQDEKRFVVKPTSGPPERRKPALPKLLRKLFQLFDPVTRGVY